MKDGAEPVSAREIQKKLREECYQELQKLRRTVARYKAANRRLRHALSLEVACRYNAEHDRFTGRDMNAWAGFDIPGKENKSRGRTRIKQTKNDRGRVR